MKLVEVSWVRTGSGFTLLFETMVLALVKSMPVAAVARLVGKQDTRLRSVFHHYVEVARAEVSHAAARRVGIDETSLKRGHHYLTLLVDLDGIRMLFATEGRDTDTFRALRGDLEANGGHPDRTGEVRMDLSAVYRKGQREHLPHGRITFDRFHVVKLLNEAVDQVRRAERKEAPELSRTRYLWLKNASSMSRSQQRHLDQFLLGQSHLRTVMSRDTQICAGGGHPPMKAPSSGCDFISSFPGV